MRKTTNDQRKFDTAFFDGSWMAFTKLETAVAAFVTWFTRIWRRTTEPGSEKSVVLASVMTWVDSVLRVVAIVVIVFQMVELEPKSGGLKSVTGIGVACWVFVFCGFSFRSTAQAEDFAVSRKIRGRVRRSGRFGKGG